LSPHSSEQCKSKDGIQRSRSSKAKNNDWTKGMCNVCIEFKKYLEVVKSGEFLKQYYKKRKTYFYCWGNLCQGKSFRRDKIKE
jgi:hypothetical protein